MQLLICLRIFRLLYSSVKLCLINIKYFYQQLRTFALNTGQAFYSTSFRCRNRQRAGFAGFACPWDRQRLQHTGESRQTFTPANEAADGKNMAAPVSRKRDNMAAMAII